MKSQIFKWNVIDHPSTKWLQKYAFEIGVFLTSFTVRFVIYTDQPFANGWDAYFYIVQIKSYLEEGAMHSNRVSLFYPVLIGVYYLVRDYELTYQVLSAAIVATVSWQLYRVTRTINQKSNAKYLVASFSVLSYQLTFVGAQFPKNLLGVALLLLLLEYLLKANYLKSLLTVALGIFVHKMTAALSLVLVVIFPITKILNNQVRYFFIGFIAIVGILIIFPELLTDITISRDGFGFGAPVLQGQKFTVSLTDSITTLWIIEIVIVHLLVAFVGIAIIVKRGTQPAWYVLVTLLLLLIFPLLEWSAFGLSYRLLMVFLIMGPLLVSYFNIRLKAPMLVSICACLLIGGVFSSVNFPTDQLDPPYGKYRILTDKIEAIEGLDPELLIIHKSFAEYYTFKTGKDALPWVPEYQIDADKLWRIAYGVNAKTISYYAEGFNEIDGYYFQLSPWYSLIREDLWTSCLQRIEKENRELFAELNDWKNPSVIRPAYLLNQKKQ